jgi:Holliday junction resolvase RusA-like endonuclease
MQTVYLISLQKPKSYNSSNKRGYMERLKKDALVQLDGQESLVHSKKKLYSRIYYFHRRKSDIDADNLSKPILDSFKDIVIRDDSQIVWRSAVKIDLSDSFTISNEEIPERWYSGLIEAIGDETKENILFIEIGEIEELEVFFGRERK